MENEEKKYFEFRDHDYYALITVTLTEEDREQELLPFMKAVNIYLDNVRGEDVEEILEEGLPIPVTEEYAFSEFMKLDTHKYTQVYMVINDFNSRENDVVVIDGSIN